MDREKEQGGGAHMTIKEQFIPCLIHHVPGREKLWVSKFKTPKFISGRLFNVRHAGSLHFYFHTRLIWRQYRLLQSSALYFFKQ